VTDLGCGDMVLCNLMEGENRKEAFLKMNPFHTIPTMESDSWPAYCLGESQSMMRYIARKCKSELYPGEAKLAARTDWAMDALGTTVYGAFADIVYPILGFAGPPADQAKANEQMKVVLDMFCATFMPKKKKFICGDKMTIADYKALPFFFCLNHPVVELKAGVSLSPRLKKYVADLTTSIRASTWLTNADPASMSLHSFLDGKKDAGPNFQGKPIVCGEGECSDIAVGPALANEKAAKVWGMSVSANAGSAVMLARDAGVGELEPCNLMTGEHLKPEFLAKNPFHQLPTYEGSDGFCLGESNAVLRYIAANYKKALYPEGDEDRGRIDWAMDTIATGIYKKMAYGVFYGVFGFASPPGDQEQANADCTTILAEFEQAFLQNSKFVLGDKVTIAEYKFVTFLFCVSQPAIKSKTNFKLSERMQTYLADILSAIPSANVFLKDIKAFAESRK